MQNQLESSKLRDFLLTQGIWEPEVRHVGLYVAPRSHVIDGRDRVPVYSPPSPFTNVPAIDETNQQQRLYDVLQQAATLPTDQQLSKSTTMRVMLARPIKHLTLRLGAMDWWAWTDDPGTCENKQQLGLDPAAGTGD